MEETGLHRLTPADSVPAHRLRRRHTRSGIGVPIVAWRPNNGSGRWDTFRPPEGIAEPATAILQRGANERAWILRFLSPYRRETVTVEGRSYPLGREFYRTDSHDHLAGGAATPERVSRHAQFLGHLAPGKALPHPAIRSEPHSPPDAAWPAIDSGLFRQTG